MNMEKEIMDLKSTENMHKDDLRVKDENENIHYLKKRILELEKQIKEKGKMI